MLVFKINNTDVSSYAEQGSFSVSLDPVSGDKFTCADGSVYEPDCGYNASVSAKLAKLPSDIASTVSYALSSGTVDVICTSPTTVSGKFKVKKFSAKPRAFADTWDIEVSLSRTEVIGGSGSL